MRERKLDSTHLTHPQSSQDFGLGEGARQSGRKNYKELQQEKYENKTVVEKMEAIGGEAGCWM